MDSVAATRPSRDTDGPKDGARDASRVPLPRVTAASSILNVLRQDILSMALKPGEPLAEKVLTARFGVSRTPVREALMRLAEEGLVDVFPQSGTYVGRIPFNGLPEAVVIRQALEGADDLAGPRLPDIIERYGILWPEPAPALPHHAVLFSRSIPGTGRARSLRPAAPR